jgi:hypothetical protein
MSVSAVVAAPIGGSAAGKLMWHTAVERILFVFKETDDNVGQGKNVAERSDVRNSYTHKKSLHCCRDFRFQLRFYVLLSGRGVRGGAVKAAQRREGREEEEVKQKQAGTE